MIYAQLPDVTDPYTPHLVMLNVTLVGDNLFFEVVDRSETYDTSVMKTRKGSSIMVNASALVNILRAMSVAEADDAANRQTLGFMDKNFYVDYESPFDDEKKDATTAARKKPRNKQGES